MFKDRSFKPAGYIFSGIEFAESGQLTVLDGDKIHLARRPREILRFLIENRNRVVSRHELLEKFWDGHDVYDDALRKAVASIRKAINDLDKPPSVLETVYGEGFRFIADVRPVSAPGRTSGALRSGKNGIDRFTGIEKGPTVSYESGRGLKARIAVVFGFVLLIFGSLAFYYKSSGVNSNAATMSDEKQRAFSSIAVMPIVNLTGDLSNEYFSDGITESIITQLSRGGELRIISRSSTFIYKNKAVDAREVGRQLGVDTLLEGGVQKIGDKVSIRVRLVSTVDGSVVWTSSDFERPMTNAYDLQDLIACGVAAELRSQVCGNRRAGHTADGYAYQEYLKGRFEWNKRTAAGIKKSIDHYKKAIDFDPEYTLAYAGLADSYAQGIWHVPFNERDVLPLAKDAAMRAIELDATSAEAHTALASVLGLEWDWSGMDREIGRAIELDPQYARAYHVRAFAQMVTGRYPDSIESINKAEELDPLNMVIQTDKGELLWSAGQVEEAFEQWHKTLQIDPNFVMAIDHRAIANELLGNDEAALADMALVMRLNGNSAAEIAKFRTKAKKLGIRQIRQLDLRALAMSRTQKDPMTAAYLSVLAGRNEDSLRALQSAFDDHSSKIVLISSPVFSSLRFDPRFVELSAKVGLR